MIGQIMNGQMINRQIVNGQMMNGSLSIIDVLEYAAEVHPKAEIVSAKVEGDRHRQTYPETLQRVAQLAHALVELGIKPGDRVATLAWNNHRHVELYYAIAGIGAICHTINPRLPGEQMTYIVNHADDGLLFFDTAFASIVANLRSQFPKQARYVAMTGVTNMPGNEGLEDVLCYENLLVGKPKQYTWPELDENTASGLCYTSGTTGVPKGALYSHRSCLLASMFTIIGADGSFRVGDRLLPIVPMFHVNAWNMPYIAMLTGCSLIMPGSYLDGSNLFKLMDDERVTASWGVPTVWIGLLEEMRKQNRKPDSLRQVMIGGSAPSRSMLLEFEKDFGIEAMQGWGMTETSPVGSIGILVDGEAELPLQQRIDIKNSGSRRLFGVRMKLVDDTGAQVAHDGESVGQLYVKGPAVISSYFKNDKATNKSFDQDGWFATGDVAKLSEGGVLSIVDREKDLIKSGGEWISSIDLENAVSAHPAVAECAVIAVPHPKWGERPRLIVVPAIAQPPSREDLLEHLSTEFAKWQLPDDVIFVEKLPHTATGKVSKRHLRESYGGETRAHDS